MSLDEFRAELETRLLIEKEYIIQELSLIDDDQEKFELLGNFNEKYKESIKRLAHENGIDLNAPYQDESNPSNSDLSYEQIILSKTMSIYEKLVEELYEKITSIQ